MYGLREIASGALILAAEDPKAWLWTRVVGDALDGLLLSEGMMADNLNRKRAILATLAVAPVVVLDTLYARRSLKQEKAEYVPAPAQAHIRAPSRLVRDSEAVAARSQRSNCTRACFNRRGAGLECHGGLICSFSDLPVSD